MEYSRVVSDDAIARAAASLADRNIEAIVVNNGAEALSTIQELIPVGASVNNGASRTLEEIGFVEYLKGNEHEWKNLHEKIIAETDPLKKAELRKQAASADVYLGSVHALAESGEIVIASNTGSQLPGIVFLSPSIIFVVGAQKIVPDLDAALKRLREYVVPREDERMKSVGAAGTMLSKILILEKEPPFMKRHVRVIIVKEVLGF